MAIQLIQASDFVGKALLSAHHRAETLTIAINNAQTAYLKPLIGQDLYNETQILPYSVRITDLVNTSKDWLVHLSYVNYIAVTGVNDTQSGLRVNIDDNSEQISSLQMAAILKQHRSFADAAKADLIAFLNANKTIFPEWETSCGESRNTKTFRFGKVGQSVQSKNYFQQKDR